MLTVSLHGCEHHSTSGPRASHQYTSCADIVCTAVCGQLCLKHCHCGLTLHKDQGLDPTASFFSFPLFIDIGLLFPVFLSMALFLWGEKNSCCYYESDLPAEKDRWTGRGSHCLWRDSGSTLTTPSAAINNLQLIPTTSSSTATRFSWLQAAACWS